MPLDVCDGVHWGVLCCCESLTSLKGCSVFWGFVMWRLEDLDMSWDFESGLTLALGVVEFWLLLIGQSRRTNKLGT